MTFIDVFALVRNRRLLAGLFLAGFMIALAGNVAPGPRIGIGAALWFGVVFAMIPLIAVIFSLARAVAESVLMLAVVMIVSLIRITYVLWRQRHDATVVERLAARSYRSPR